MLATIRRSFDLSSLLAKPQKLLLATKLTFDASSRDKSAWNVFASSFKRRIEFALAWRAFSCLRTRRAPANVSDASSPNCSTTEAAEKWRATAQASIQLRAREMISQKAQLFPTQPHLANSAGRWRPKFLPSTNKSLSDFAAAKDRATNFVVR